MPVFKNESKQREAIGVKTFKISSANEEQRGSLEIGAEDIHLRLGAGRTIKRTYVVGLARKGGCALNKCRVSLQYYDIFGNKEESEFVMNENDFKVLKNILKK
ncbi:MAG: hypothetical protein QW343_02805 [Candidatus Norongarragalinales archaeon]